MSVHLTPLEPSARTKPAWGAGPLYEKLRPAPHAMPAEQVAHIQRMRLCGAIVQAVAEHGYGKVTVSRLHKLAGVSKHTLFDRFGHSEAKRQCLLAAIETMLTVALEYGQAQQQRGRNWRERLALTLVALAQLAADYPAAAHVLLIEAYEPDAGALEMLVLAYERLEELLADCFEDLPAGQDPPPLIVKGILAAAAQLARTHLLAGCEQQLPRVARELAVWASACCAGTALPAQSGAEHSCGTATSTPSLTVQRDTCVERLWMLEACTRLAGEHGYASLAISRIEKEARVPRGTLRRHFTGVRECFTCAYELACGQALRGVITHAPAPWSPRGPQPLLERLTGQLAQAPELVRIAFCELLAAGPAGVHAHTRLIEGFAHALAGEAPPSLRPSPVALNASAAAVWGVAGHLAACGRVQRLPANQQTLVRLMPPIAIARTAHQATRNQIAASNRQTVQTG